MHRGRRTRDGRPVVIKTPRSPQPTAAEVARLDGEYRLGQGIEHDGVVRLLALERDGHRPALVMEDFGGVALAQTLARGRLPTILAVEIAVQVATGVASSTGAG